MILDDKQIDKQIDRQTDSGFELPLKYCGKKISLNFPKNKVQYSLDLYDNSLSENSMYIKTMQKY